MSFYAELNFDGETISSSPQKVSNMDEAYEWYCKIGFLPIPCRVAREAFMQKSRLELIARDKGDNFDIVLRLISM